jgi:2',3'-cyclic-nucleotide 2'-phosphodiesterase (5'-nucleotidase family)
MMKTFVCSRWKLTMKLLCLSILLFVISPAQAELKQLVIIHTNDFHGHIAEENEYAGAARLAAFVSQVRRENKAVLVLDAGDAISGTPVSTLFKGLPIFEVLNQVGYDVATLGNHEFDHGYEQIALFRETVNHPIISANAYSPTGELIADAPALILEIEGIQIGIIGLITDNTPAMISPIGNRGISFAPPVDVLRGMVKALRPNVDLLMVLSHVGHQPEIELVTQVPGVDILIGGHSHSLVEKPVHINDSWVAQANRYGSHVGFIKVTVDTDKNQIVEFEGELIPANKLPEADKKVAGLVLQWEQKVSALVDFEIATTHREIDGAELQRFLESILAKAANVPLGFYNPGGIRDKIRSGSITARHIWNIEPFGNNLVTLTTSGEVARRIFDMEGIKHPRSSSINPDDTITFATNSFVAAQAQRTEGDLVQVRDRGVLIRDVIIEYLKNNGAVAPES